VELCDHILGAADGGKSECSATNPNGTFEMTL
jgi:hypothetical protein